MDLGENVWKCDTSGVGKGRWIYSFPGLRAPTAALPGAIICDLYEVGKAPNGAFGGKFRKNIFTNL